MLELNTSTGRAMRRISMLKTYHGVRLKTSQDKELEAVWAGKCSSTGQQCREKRHVAMMTNSLGHQPMCVLRHTEVSSSVTHGGLHHKFKGQKSVHENKAV